MLNQFKHWVLSWLTMERISESFIDRVDGSIVYLYRDCFGQEFLSNYFYLGFRVKVERVKND